MNQADLTIPIPLIDTPSNRRGKIIPIGVIVVVVVGLILSILTQPFAGDEAAPSTGAELPADAAAQVAAGSEQLLGEGASPQTLESGKERSRGINVTGGLAWIGQILVSFIALLSSIGELTGVKVSSLFSSSKAKTNVEEFPFHVIQDFDALLDYLFPEPKISLISDRKIPYLPQIHEETDAAFQGRGLVLIRGRSKTGKTREACELLRRWWYLGPTVLVARSHVGLKPPFKIPANLPTRNLVLIFDDIDRYLGDAAALKRMEETLQFFQSICHDRGEVRVIATARQEDEFWRKLGYDKAQAPWNEFELVQLDPLSPAKAQDVIAGLAQSAGIEIAPELAKTLAEKNDGTFLNLALAFRGWMIREIKSLTPEEVRSFEGALKSTWRRRYEELVKARPGVGPVYAAVDFLQSHNLPLRPAMIVELAAEMSMRRTSLTVLSWFDRLRAWMDRAPALNWYRSPKTRVLGWVVICAGGLALLYLLAFAFLHIAPGDLQINFFLDLFQHLQTQLLCLAPLWALLIPFLGYLVMNIMRNLALRRGRKNLEFLLATEVPMRGSELRPYENQFEGNGRTRNWDLRCYAGDLRERSFTSGYAPRLSAVYLALAEQLRLSGEVSAARELACTAQRISPGDPAAPFVLGKIDFDEQNYRAAIEHFTESQGLYSRSNNACRVLERAALSHLYLGDASTAEAVAAQALKAMPGLPTARWTLGLAQICQGKKQAGEQTCRRAIATKQPVPPEVQHALEAAELAQAVWASAVPAVGTGTARRKAPVWLKGVLRTAAVLLVLVLISAAFVFIVPRFYSSLGNGGSSISLTNSLLRVFPGAPVLYALRGYQYEQLGENEQAIVDLTEAVRVDPGFSWAYMLRGGAFMEMEKNESAIADFLEVLRLDPENTDSLTGLLGVYTSTREYEKGVNSFSEFIRANPQNSIAIFWRGILNYRIGNYQEAIADTSEAIRINPIAVGTYYLQRGYYYKVIGDYEKAAADYSAAISTNPGDSSNYSGRALVYLALGQYEKATVDFTEAIRIYPNNNSAYAMRGGIYGELGELEKAISDLTEAIRISPKDTGYYILRAKIYAAQGNNEKALADLDQALTIDAQNWTALEDRAAVYASLGDYENAIADYSASLRIHSQNAASYVGRGAAYEATGETDLAVADQAEAARLDPNRSFTCDRYFEPYHQAACYTQILRANPEDTAAYLGRGQSYYSAQEYDKAIADYTEAIRIDPQRKWAYNQRGRAFEIFLDYDQAIADYSEAIRIDPQDVWAHKSRGLLYYYRNAYEKVIEDFTAVIRSDPKDAVAYTRRGEAYHATGDYEKAIADYAEAIRLDPEKGGSCTGNDSIQVACSIAATRIDPENIDAYFNLGNAYYNIDYYEKAVDAYSVVIRKEPENLNALNNRGINYGRLREFEKALADYTEIIRIAPESSYAYNNRCWALYESGEYQQAVADCNQAIRLDPKDGYAYDSRGWVYYALGEYNRAIADFTKAIHYEPLMIGSIKGRGDSYAALGDEKKASIDYAQVLRMTPGSYENFYYRGGAYDQLGQYEKAAADYTEAIRQNPFYAPAYSARAEAYKALGKEAEAAADLQKFNELMANR